ncbi:MAG: competence protein ComEC, partial [Actinomycetota bacterium]
PLANLLAVPIAGPLTAWGLGGGLVAGVLGEPFAALLHVPTNAMVWWIAGVAHAGARLPLGSVDVRAVLIGLIVAAVVVWWRRVAVPVVAVALVVIAMPPRGALRDVEIARGVRLWRAGAVVLVVDGSASSAPVLDGLRRAGVGTVDLLVARRGSKDVAALIADIRSRHRIRSIAAPTGHRIRDATAIADDLTLHAGRLVVRLEPHDGALDVDL